MIMVILQISKWVPMQQSYDEMKFKELRRDCDNQNLAL